MDRIAIFGVLVGVAGIVLGNALEGGHFSSLIQVTAGLIVFSGTLGATLLSHNSESLKMAWELAKKSFKDSENQSKNISQKMVQISKKAKAESLVAIEADINLVPSQFAKKALRFVVDGIDKDTIKSVFESEIAVDEKRYSAAAKVWSDAGGFAPTIGILGAVLGLIHVMGNLTNTAELGKGIAVAFVATIYGVGSANLVFLPISNKIKRLSQINSDQKDMILEGALSIAKSHNPVVTEELMRPYWTETQIEI